MPNFSGVWNLKDQVQAIAAGRWTGVPSPELYVWGSNTLGQLGDDSTVNKNSPIQLDAEVWSAVSAGRNNTTAVKSDGTMWSWGDNTAGNLGIGTQGLAASRSSPVQVGVLTDWLIPAAGGYTSWAINTSGKIYGWGANDFGQLGDGTIQERSNPTQIGALTTWSKVAAGQSRNVSAIKTDGTMWSWGRDLYGATGTQQGGNVNSPVQVGALTTWADVSVGFYGAAALKTDGTLWTWGGNSNGRVGDNTTVNKSSPVQVGAETDWAKAIHSVSVIAVKTTGTLWAWGGNFAGGLGLGDVIPRSSPVQVGALTNWSTPSSSRGGANLVKKTDGTLWTWGRNSYGQLGDNTVVYKSSPIQVGALTNWDKVAGGANHFISTFQGTTN